MMHKPDEQSDKPINERYIEDTEAIPIIRNRLFLGAILFSMILLLCIMAVNLQRIYVNARNDVIELSKNSSAKNAEDIELFFLRHEDALLTTSEVLAYGLKRDDITKEEVEEILHNISVAYDKEVYSKYADKKFTGIYATVNGELVHGMRSPEELPEGYNPLERPWYKEAMKAGGRITFGEPYWDIYTSYLVVTATKLLDDGETVVGMDITLEDLQSAGGNMDVSINLNGKKQIHGYGFVLTDEGYVMAHHDASEQGKCYDDPENPMYEAFLQIKQHADDVEEYFETEIDGVNYGIFPHRLNNDWYVVTMMDLEDIRASLTDYYVFIMIGTIIVALLALSYCFIITRAYIKSEKLTEKLTSAFSLATKDELTGHGNRTAYDLRIRELHDIMNSAKDISFAIIMMDLNDLKYVNDHYGHAAGDQYIRNSCQLVKEIIPEKIYRIGGDEFVMFLVGELYEQHEVLCAQLTQAVTEANFSLVPEMNKPSIAIGKAVHIAGERDNIDELLRKADSLMYTDKAEIKQKRLEKSEHNAILTLERIKNYLNEAD